MTAAARFPSLSFRQRAVSRIRLALAASVAGHLLLAALMVTEPLGGKPGSESTVSLTVRLAPQPATEATSLVLSEVKIPVAVLKVTKRSPVLDPETRTTAATANVPAPRDAPALSVPQVPDPTYYSARELDAYPRPVAPLELDRIAGRNAVTARVALALLIDEQGIVNKIEFAEPAAPDRLKEELRALLATTLFLPARKDGRAVRSSVQISISFAAADVTVSH